MVLVVLTAAAAPHTTTVVSADIIHCCSMAGRDEAEEREMIRGEMFGRLSQWERRGIKVGAGGQENDSRF